MRRTAPRLLIAGVIATVALVGCTDDRVSLSYGLAPGATLRYELDLRAEVERTLEDETQVQDVVATFEVGQAILEATEQGVSQARLSLTPLALVVDGRAVDPGAGQDFLVELGADGRVVGIGDPTGEATEELAPLGIERLLPRLRPVLPREQVFPGDTWSSSTEFGDAGGTFSLATRSRLAQLGVIEGEHAALVRTTYVSPVDRRERFANAVVELTGTDVGSQEAWFALDGFLIRSVSDSVGTYDVTFHPPEEELETVPVEGSLVVRLHTELRLIGTPPAP